MGIFNKFKNGKNPVPKKDISDAASKASGDYHGITLDKNLDGNIKTLKTIFKDCDDVVYRPFKITEQINALLVFIDGMTRLDSVDNFIIKPLLLEYRMANINITDAEDAFRHAKETVISSSNINQTDQLHEVLLHIMSGNIAIMIDGYEFAIIVDVKGFEHRTVEQPTSEATTRGPKDSFNETIRINTALVRRRLRDPKLKLKNYTIGRRSKTQLVILYIEDIVNPKLVDEVYKRLDLIDIDSISSGIVEQLLEDNWLSPFPQFKTTERPDKVTAALLEGKVCIITDNTPFVSILPATMNDLLTSPDDYYERWLVSLLIRVVRFIGAVASTILPALYISMVSYNPGMIPPALALSISEGREGVPFPAFVEAFIMEIAFELMREAGIRLPGNLGQTVGVVGAVVIGQAAVAAGIVSPTMVVVVALTGIANFAVPSFEVALSYRTLRFGLMIFATTLGLYGLILGLLLILSHLSILKSFGTPYMAPWIPLKLGDLKDTLLRAPWVFMRRRPAFMHLQDENRADAGKMKKILHGRKNQK